MRGWYRRFIVDAFRRNNLKTCVPVQESVSLNTFSLRSCNSSGTRISQFCQPASRNLVLQNVLKNNQWDSSFFDGAKRFYSVDRSKVRHFKTRVYKWWWSKNRNISISIVLCSGLVITEYFRHLEVVPYTKRRHFVLLSSSIEKQLGELRFAARKELKFKGKILSPLNPENIRVQKIAHAIVEVAKSQNAHLEGLKWEVIVVDKPIFNAYCCPGGKIVVFTGLLKHFKADVELAFIIGHEVGHAVARHFAEDFTGWWLLGSVYDRLRPAFCERREKEADCIGLFLMASAGYDPRVAVEVQEKLAQFNSRSENDSGKKVARLHSERAQLLSQSKAMEEALCIYTKALVRSALLVAKRELADIFGLGEDVDCRGLMRMRGKLGRIKGN